MAAPDPNPPEPIIPVGLATKLGALGTTVLGVAALIAAVWGGDHTPETIGALASAAIVLIATIAGRFAQAYAIYRDRPAPAQVQQTIVPADPDATTYMPPSDIDLSGEPPRRPRGRKTR